VSYFIKIDLISSLLPRFVDPGSTLICVGIYGPISHTLGAKPKFQGPTASEFAGLISTLSLQRWTSSRKALNTINFSL